MPSLRPLSDDMIADIDGVLRQHESKCVPVYAEAERIRRRWEAENIALEDIITVFVERCGAHGVAISFDRSCDVDALFEELSPDLGSGASH